MWLLVAEAVIALGMLVFVVWWTIGTRRKAESDRTLAQQAAEPPSPPAALPAPGAAPPPPSPPRPGGDGPVA